MKLYSDTLKTTASQIGLAAVLAMVISSTSFAQQRTAPAMNFGDTPAATRSTRMAQPQARMQSLSQSHATTQRSHLISLNSQGDVQGHVAALKTSNSDRGIADLSIYLVRNGKIAYQTKTNTDGAFSMTGVNEGAYSFVATGPTGFVTYGVYATRNDNATGANVMESAAVSPRIAGLKKILAENLPSAVIDEILQGAMPGSRATQTPQPIAGTNQVRIVNGQLAGQIHTLLMEGKSVGGTMVNLIQNGRRVADVQVDPSGKYSIPDLQPGIYDFIAVGHKGLAAIRFEAVGQDSPMTRVAYRRAPKLVALSLDVCLTCPQDSAMISQSMDYSMGQDSYPVDHHQPASIEYAGQAVGCGGAAGGSCGGAGDFSGYSNAYSAGSHYRSGGGGYFRGGRLFSGGGGGAGRLLMLGGLAGSITAIADDPPASSPNQ